MCVWRIPLRSVHLHRAKPGEYTVHGLQAHLQSRVSTERAKREKQKSKGRRHRMRVHAFVLHCMKQPFCYVTLDVHIS